MIGKVKLSIFISLLIFISCSKNRQDFVYKKIQKTEERIIIDTLNAIDSLNLSRFQLYDVGTLQVNKDYIYISGRRKIVAILKDDFTKYKTLKFSKGRGPKEIQSLASFHVQDSLLAVLDEKQNKVMLYSLPYKFIREYRFDKLMPHRIQIFDKNSFVLFTPMVGLEYLFSLVNTQKEIVRQFENIPSKHNPMVYEGWIRTRNNYIYYAGYSEPLLKKYIKEGDLKYSTATIDNFNTESNYVRTEGGSMMGYTPAAQFSTLNFDISKDHWFVIPFNRKNLPATHIDVYKEKNGEYIGTVVGLKAKTGKIVTDDKTIYTISRTKDDYVLTLYENKLNL